MFGQFSFGSALLGSTFYDQSLAEIAIRSFHQTVLTNRSTPTTLNGRGI
jgi:hypothetical protein